MKSLTQPVPLYKQVYDQLKASILNGDFEPGEKISLSKLAAEFNISRTPLREAFRQLQNEGLLEQDVSGSKVVSVSLEKLRELFACRLILEKEIIGQVTLSISEEKIDLASQMIEKAEHSFKEGDQIKFLEYNAAFHETLINACDNQTLAELLNQIIVKLWLYRAQIVHSTDTEQIYKLIEEHKIILNSIKDRNAESAVKAVETHILNDKLRAEKLIKQ